MSSARGPLSGLRVVEVGDATIEYCGLLLAGLGAEVIKVEPTHGAPSRRLPPFRDGNPDTGDSLFFWNYNRGKKSIALDALRKEQRDQLASLIASADVVLDSTAAGHLEERHLNYEIVRESNPNLIFARLTAFGDDGPWSNWQGTDLIHLALGGVMSNCGYDPDPHGNYDLPPIAPQFWHAYHIAGEQLAIGVLGALNHRERTGEGQFLTVSVHEAVAKNTELDTPNWVMRRSPLHRQTGQHAAESISRIPTIANTKDGRWVMARSMDTLAGGAKPGSANSLAMSATAKFLDGYGAAADLVRVENDEAARAQQGDDASATPGRSIPGSGGDGGLSFAQAYRAEVVARFIRSFRYQDVPWQEAQEAGLMFAPLRKPHENATDEHWLARNTFADVEHPELGRSFRYVTSKWRSTTTEWVVGRRAPLLNEDEDEVLGSLDRAPLAPTARRPAITRPATPDTPSVHGKPFALDDVRILDFTWFLASAGGTRFLTAMGAESIKVEWRSSPDTRFGAQAPVGGRAARDVATGPLEGIQDPDLGGQFHNKNAGKRGLSLNVRDPRGLDIARRLVRISDIVAEGFSPGVLERWGLGYDVQRSLRSDIIYAQQSGAGQSGTYAQFRAVGPIAQSLAGQSEMSGLPEPAMPAGWGYSYADWVGAYSFGLAMLSALYDRERTGQGCWIDSSQVEAGIFLTGVPVLDWSVNGRPWTRTGNRAAYGGAAPHGAFRCAGTDRWIAIACETEEHWRALTDAAGHPEWQTDPRFADPADRQREQASLDELIGQWVRTHDAFDLAAQLQALGIPAGVCQTAQDRYESDPQLAHLRWLTEVEGTKIGRWPIQEIPIRFAATPVHIGGRLDRGAPCYGEDNDYVLGELLGFNSRQIADLAADGVI